MTRLRYLAISLALLLGTTPGIALPRFSLMTGMSCASCHVSVSGGGLRTPGGSEGFRSFSLVSPSFSVPAILRENNSSIAEGLFTWGLDLRYQLAKRPNDRGELTRQFFGMQIAPSLAWHPREDLTVHATVNVVEPEYPGQQRVVAAATWRPMDNLALQAGYLETPFGLRHDDHTMYSRRFAGPAPQGLPPTLSDLGLVVDYEPVSGVNLIGALQDGRTMQALIPSLPRDPVATLQLNLRHDMDDLHLLVGGSHLFRTRSGMTEIHAGLGWTDLASLLGEWGTYANTLTDRRDESRYWTLIGTVHVLDGLAVEGRVEQARRRTGGPDLDYTQYTAGFHIFVTPWLELCPEYRYSELPGRTFAQWVGQIHGKW